jgi:hypothetical protein
MTWYTLLQQPTQAIGARREAARKAGHGYARICRIVAGPMADLLTLEASGQTFPGPTHPYFLGRSGARNSS